MQTQAGKWTQVQTQLDASADAASKTDANADASSKTDASAWNWTQAARRTQGSQADASSQTDASAEASSKTDARQPGGRKQPNGRKCRSKQQNGRKCERKQPNGRKAQGHRPTQVGALGVEGTHLIVVKGKKPAKRTDKGGGWLLCWFFERAPPRIPKLEQPAKRTQALKQTQADANISNWTQTEAAG